MIRETSGALILIGGGEKKEGRAPILREVCRRAHGAKGKLVLVTAATQVPLAYMDTYLPLFHDLGVRNVEVLDVRRRADGYDEKNLAKLCGATVVFFTGGQQLRIASQLGGTPVFQALHELHANGATIAGTSAGAAMMPDTMLVSGSSDESPDVSRISMAPGIGLLAGVVVDSHFSQRGRIGRLMAAVAQNPNNMGLGIDEDTAIVVEPDRVFRVIGSGGVHVVDGAGISYSSLVERDSHSKIGLHDVRLHVLRQGHRFDLNRARPVGPHEPAAMPELLRVK
ncbi:MAG: Cyanophycinase [uncultured Chloroflexi bacterium]|uniref:Cyanophycinase n=1 Tax=uncultured Chloroflexota bacterium TaxID=166587 RepID=A0A6J4IZH3_9CHLR|nr:MAG: Cyanophycinase [uncultured Chloroflexota bacterium]